MFIDLEKYCNECGYPEDQCECGQELERDAEEVEDLDEEYL